MLVNLLSGDKPRSRALSIVLLVILIGLAFAPFLFPGTRSMETAARICIFVALVASYDLMLGYGGIVSFAHTMFFRHRRLWRGAGPRPIWAAVSTR